MATVSLLDQRGSRTIESGRIIYDLTNVYQVIANADTDTVFMVLNYPEVLQVGQLALAADGTQLFADGQRNAYRPEGIQSKSKWHVELHFTNRTNDQDGQLPPDPTTGQHVQDPTDAPQQVEIGYTAAYEPVRDASFVRVENQLGTLVTPPPDMIGYTGYVRNTSKEILWDAKKRVFLPTWRVSRIVNEWPATWDALPGTTNNAAIQITQSDPTGPKLTRSYGAREGMLLNIQKQDMWTAGRLYFKATFLIAIDETNLHRVKHPDVGTRRLLFVGQYRNNIGQPSLKWDQPALDLFPDRNPPITSGNTQYIASEPVPLNGYGQEIPKESFETYDPERDSFYVVYDVASMADWSVLGIV